MYTIVTLIIKPGNIYLEILFLIIFAAHSWAGVILLLFSLVRVWEKRVDLRG